MSPAESGVADIAEEHADGDSPGGRLGYLGAAWVVRHLTHRLLAADTSEFEAVFDLIEHLSIAGDPYVSQLALIGYLEGMQMEAVTSLGVDPESFRPWLRPVSTDTGCDAQTSRDPRARQPVVGVSDRDCVRDRGRRAEGLRR
jgi:hypothetical protein